MAAQNGHTAVVEILVKAGADVKKVSHIGYDEVLTSRRRIHPNTLYSLPYVHEHAGGMHILKISLSFYYVNPTHPASGGTLCMWKVYVLMIQ